MLSNKMRFFVLNWTCKCGKIISDDRNFCMYCDREKPLNY